LREQSSGRGLSRAHKANQHNSHRGFVRWPFFLGSGHTRPPAIS
jgi:hypothetical protein